MITAKVAVGIDADEMREDAICEQQIGNFAHGSETKWTDEFPFLPMIECGGKRSKEESIKSV